VDPGADGPATPDPSVYAGSHAASRGLGVPPDRHGAQGVAHSHPRPVVVDHCPRAPGPGHGPHLRGDGRATAAAAATATASATATATAAGNRAQTAATATQRARARAHARDLRPRARAREHPSDLRPVPVPVPFRPLAASPPPTTPQIHCTHDAACDLRWPPCRFVVEPFSCA
jgi:hypothetical protein